MQTLMITFNLERDNRQKEFADALKSQFKNNHHSDERYFTTTTIIVDTTRDNKPAKFF